jgi:hypothetical protein
LLVIYLLLNACAANQNLNGYKFVYRFQLDQEIDDHRAVNDTDSVRLKLSSGDPTWYNINSRQRLSNQEVNEIKKCIESDRQNVVNCQKKDVYYVTIEI